MDKKKLIIIIVVITVVLIVLFTIKSCTSKEKYKNAFINANIEMTCIIKNDPALVDSENDITPLLTNAYAKHGLPTSNDETMIEILDFYENNEEVQKIIKQYANHCENDVPKFLYPAPTN